MNGGALKECLGQMKEDCRKKKKIDSLNGYFLSCRCVLELSLEIEFLEVRVLTEYRDDACFSRDLWKWKSW